MSRIGKLPVEIPAGVNISVNDGVIAVSGPNGELRQDFRSEISIAIEDGKAILDRVDDSKVAKSYHGLYRKLVANMVEGVSKGFSKTLVIIGVGYRAELNDHGLTLNLGYSNPIDYPLAEGLTASVEGNTRIVISGADKQLVGQASAEIRSLRPPEPYKGKGVRYEDEYVRRKIGKAGIK